MTLPAGDGVAGLLRLASTTKPSAAELRLAAAIGRGLATFGTRPSALALRHDELDTVLPGVDRARRPGPGRPPSPAGLVLDSSSVDLREALGRRSSSGLDVVDRAGRRGCGSVDRRLAPG